MREKLRGLYKQLFVPGGGQLRQYRQPGCKHLLIQSLGIQHIFLYPIIFTTPRSHHRFHSIKLKSTIMKPFSLPLALAFLAGVTITAATAIPTRVTGASPSTAGRDPHDPNPAAQSIASAAVATVEAVAQRPEQGVAALLAGLDPLATPV